MYKYIVFAYDEVKPKGGLNDCIYKGNTVDDVLKAIESNKVSNTCFNIINNRSGEIRSFYFSVMDDTNMLRGIQEVL